MGRLYSRPLGEGQEPRITIPSHVHNAGFQLAEGRELSTATLPLRDSVLSN
ncbi:hypothetical protein MMIC_P0929 [Mariprofundus micogutta]|uniref:Uncharacterized protein n=1 Tax=Mariprofundus micogutta TaxID=1921010 RepID=A0A1L8CM27_9PROT|nr:hypothetical protein MMIC_P0929 [Mariprofundus micogutta]